MSTVFDVESVIVDGSATALFDTTVDTITIADVTTVPSVTIDSPETVQTVEVQVPGIQGPPGLQNVFIQSTNPATEYGWGPEEAGFVWLQI